MSKQRYTLDDIDVIRKEICEKNQPSFPQNLWSVCISGHSGPSRLTGESQAALDRWERMCEEQLRTALKAGVAPKKTR